MPRRFRNPIPGDTADPLSLAGHLARYLLWMETHHFAAGTVTIRRLMLSKFLLWCQERSVEVPAEVTSEMVERFQRHLFYYRKRNSQPLTISSQAHRLTAVRSWFAWMVRERLLEQSPAVRMQLPREEKRLPRHALAESEVETVLAQPNLATAVGLRDRAILETFYSTGLRRQEVLSLQLGDIDRRRRTVLVRLGKGRKDRVTPLARGPWPGSTSIWPRPGPVWPAPGRPPTCSSPAPVGRCIPTTSRPWCEDIWTGQA